MEFSFCVLYVKQSTLFVIKWAASGRIEQNARSESVAIKLAACGQAQLQFCTEFVMEAINRRRWVDVKPAMDRT